MKIFGFEAYALTPKNQHSQLDPVSKKCIFVGCDDVKKGYLLSYLTSHKIIISRDVIFDESFLIESKNIRDVEHEQVISKQLVKLENQSSHDSKKQEEVSSEREVIEDEEIQEIVETPIAYTKKIIKGEKSS